MRSVVHTAPGSGAPAAGDTTLLTQVSLLTLSACGGGPVTDASWLVGLGLRAPSLRVGDHLDTSPYSSRTRMARWGSCCPTG